MLKCHHFLCTLRDFCATKAEATAPLCSLVTFNSWNTFDELMGFNVQLSQVVHIGQVSLCITSGAAHLVLF